MNDLIYTYTHEMKKIQRTRLFYTHTALYLAINALLLTVNLATNPAYLWFIWPLIFWTKGLLLHAFSTFDKAPSASATQINTRIFTDGAKVQL
jgi:hypothetical protein